MDRDGLNLLVGGAPPGVSAANSGGRRIGPARWFELPRIHRLGVPEILRVARRNEGAVTNRHRINQTVPKRLWIAFHLAGVPEPCPGSRRFRILVQHQCSVIPQERVQTRVDFSPAPNARGGFRTFLDFRYDRGRQEPLEVVLIKPGENVRVWSRFPKLRQHVVVQQHRLHLREGSRTGPMARNACRAAFRSMRGTGTSSTRGCPRSVTRTLRPRKTDRTNRLASRRSSVIVASTRPTYPPHCGRQPRTVATT